MSFAIFQTQAAVLKKMTLDGTGSETEADNIAVKIDPNFSFTQTFDEQGQTVGGKSTYISATALQAFWDETVHSYVLTYNGRDWTITEASPQYKIGSNTLDHIKVKLI